MITFSDFCEELRDLLSHLHDPAYTPTPGLKESLSRASRMENEDLGALIVRAIQELKPDADTPADSRAWRFYQILTFRYLQHLSQEETAEYLALSVRHLAREQAQAIEVLASRLWTEPLAAPAVADSAQMAGGTTPVDAWHLQVEKELASLREYTATPLIDMGQVLRGAAEIAAVLAARRGVTLKLGPVEPDIEVDVHSSIMHQILVATITYLLRSMTEGWIELSARKAAGHVNVTVAGAPLVPVPPPADWLGRELLASLGGDISYLSQGDEFALRISVPLVHKARVLVIDDNQDLVHFYRRCVAGTAYELVSVPVGNRTFENIETVRPDAIVLDLMLPDVDGWELLAQLHEHHLSRDIPVVVCSVVGEEELALALGAVACLRKPVQCQQLIQALNQGLRSRAATGDSPAFEHNTAAC